MNGLTVPELVTVVVGVRAGYLLDGGSSRPGQAEGQVLGGDARKPAAHDVCVAH